MLLLLFTLIGVLFYGVRSGRLPELARLLPPWITGQPADSK